MRGAVVTIAWAIGVASGCAVEEPAPADTEDPRGREVARVELELVEIIDEAEPDLCGLAAGLPPGEVCALICDPDAFAARLVADGMPEGNCYQLRCELGSMNVSVGVCLP